MKIVREESIYDNNKSYSVKVDSPIELLSVTRLIKDDVEIPVQMLIRRNHEVRDKREFSVFDGNTQLFSIEYFIGSLFFIVVKNIDCRMNIEFEIQYSSIKNTLTI